MLSDIAGNTLLLLRCHWQHARHSCNLTFKHFIFATSLWFTHTSPGMVRFMILTSFLVLSISGRWASILMIHWILKSHGILCILFLINPSGSYSYHCVAPSKLCTLHSLQWIFLDTFYWIFLLSLSLLLLLLIFLLLLSLLLLSLLSLLLLPLLLLLLLLLLLDSSP